jgi:Zn finger protein HypA/HybF involved in hydrogenase expression
VTGLLKTTLSALKWVGQRVAAPLRRSDGPNKFRLSSVDTATTTYEGDSGWNKRPPAILECPSCAGEVLQHHAWDDINCPHCVASFDHEEFSDLELRSLRCPVCKSTMEHGQRHPEQVAFPEWATCDGCRYHWEFKHSY